LVTSGFHGELLNSLQGCVELFVVAQGLSGVILVYRMQGSRLSALRKKICSIAPPRAKKKATVFSPLGEINCVLARLKFGAAASR
jgi:hypothetical protein